MAGPSGRKSLAVADLLKREPGRFDFYQAVRLLLKLAPSERGAVGFDRPPEREAMRFRVVPAQAFPAGDLVKLTELADRQPELLVSFLGLTGPAGALPRHYTRLLIERIRAKDFSLRDWLDLFNHRSISFYWRAWEKYNLAASYERARQEGVADSISELLYSLIGLGTGHLRGRLQVPDEALLRYAGQLGHHPRSAEGLERMLSDYFNLPVSVEQLSGQWLYLEHENRAVLPDTDNPLGLNCILGTDAVIGQRVWDVQSKFRLRIGPLSYPQFRRFLPDGDGLRPLGQLTQLYVGTELDFDVCPVLQPTSVPACELTYAEEDGPHLGWNTWLQTHEFATPVTDAVFTAGGQPSSDAIVL